MPNRVVHFEIMGRPGPELAAFYKALFDWPVDVGDPVRTYAQHSHVPASDGGIGGGIGATEESTNFITVYVEVDDLDETCDSARDLGAEVVLAPTTIPEIDDLRIARIRDPHGNLVGIVQRR